MRAVTCQDATLAVADLPDPVPGPGQVVLAVTGCGICGSDLHALHFLDRMADVSARMGGGGVGGGMDLAKPMVMGHEFGGAIVAVGSRADAAGMAAETRGGVLGGGAAGAPALPPAPATPPAGKIGFMYMLAGGTDASNTDPYATKPTASNHWIKTGPHVMIVGADASFYDTYPKSADPNTKSPYVMWAGTPYQHLMAPIR